MRILIVSEIFAPAVSGVAVSTARLAANLTARGHAVMVLTANQRAAAQADETYDGCMVRRIPSVINPFRKGLRQTVLARQAAQHAVNEFKPDIIHIQDPISLSVQTARIGKEQGIPVVATHHFLPDFLYAYLPNLNSVRKMAAFWLDRRLSALYEKCAVVTVPTESVRRMLPFPTVVISNGVDTSRFQRGLAKHGPPRLLYVGRLDPEKRIGIILRACAGLSVPYELEVVGGGNLVESLKKEAALLGVAVIWTGSLPAGGAELPSAYARASVFCIASPHETESMVTLEAMASGLPVLAANGGALPELVRSDENGYLLDPDDAAAWTHAMEKLLEDPDLRRRMGERSRMIAAERDIQDTVSQMEQLYLKIV